MGEAFDIEVLAEGVETRPQADSLIAAGCREAQGFLFARPLSAEDCERVLGDGCSAGCAQGGEA